MKTQMGWGTLTDTQSPYEYHFTLYYTEIVPGLFCGAQPRHAEDVAYLQRVEGITAVLNLQQDHDPVFWNVKLEDVVAACAAAGIKHVRRPAKDFDPHSLRKTLPSAVPVVKKEMERGGRVYVHCTAGLGRAPAVCIAYLYWVHGLQLGEAYDFLTAKRPCGPKKDAIRGATYDVMDSRRADFEGFSRLPAHAWATLNNNDRLVLQSLLPPA
ncbi:MAG: hypothetical protein WDW38_002367 [Sanguina aurantia]